MNFGRTQPERNFVRTAVRAGGVILALLPALAAAGCGKSYTYKYKLTVFIRDHGELKSASNVVSVHESPTLMHGIAPPVLCGEATVVPLNNGRYVFALLNGIYREPVSGRSQWYSSPTPILLKHYGLSLDWAKGDDAGIRALPSVRQPVTLVSYELPEFVTFKDLNDPTSIAQVDPEHPEATLGEGVLFEKATLEVTDEWVTRGKISGVLPWLNRWTLNSWQQYLDGSDSGSSVHYYKTFQFSRCNRLTE